MFTWFVDHIIDDQVIDKATVKIILSEGFVSQTKMLERF